MQVGVMYVITRGGLSHFNKCQYGYWDGEKGQL